MNHEKIKNRRSASPRHSHTHNNARRAVSLAWSCLLILPLKARSTTNAEEDLPTPMSESTSASTVPATTTCLGVEGDDEMECHSLSAGHNGQSDEIVVESSNFASDITAANYGVDVSWPIQHLQVSTNYAWLPHNLYPDKFETPEEYKDMPIQPLGNRAKIYEDFMEGCRKYFGKGGNKCDATERDRIYMSLDQPARMTNYTELGFKKIRAPEAVFKLIKDFWETNRHDGKTELVWEGYTYTNHWDMNTTMVSVEDTDLIGGGHHLQKKIWDMAQDTMSEWVGRPLQTSSLFGIRIYHKGAILATHVDRLPLVTSAIINVDQDPDMEGDWPLEVYGHDGRVYNVSMRPGDMVLYESHSLLHGRPFALPGKFYANIFIHFEPVPLWNTQRLAQLGDVESLKKAAEEDRQSLFQTDENKWQPLHEAVRAGHLDAVRFLLDQGANVNAETLGGKYPIDWAMDLDETREEMIHLLRDYGGITRAEYDAQAEL